MCTITSSFNVFLHIIYITSYPLQHIYTLSTHDEAHTTAYTRSAAADDVGRETHQSHTVPYSSPTRPQTVYPNAVNCRRRCRKSQIASYCCFPTSAASTTLRKRSIVPSTDTSDSLISNIGCRHSGPMQGRALLPTAHIEHPTPNTRTRTRQHTQPHMHHKPPHRQPPAPAPDKPTPAPHMHQPQRKPHALGLNRCFLFISQYRIKVLLLYIPSACARIIVAVT